MTTNCNRAPSVVVGTGTDLVATCARAACTHEKIRAVSSRESDRSASFSMKRVPPSNLVWFKLELESQHELQPSRRADAGGTGIEHVRDPPKSRGRRDVGRRIRINRMIEKIEGLGAKTHAHMLGDGRPLLEPQVHLPIPRAACNEAP